MKEVLISIRPEWCELIASGKKTVEVRKTRPKLETPFKCYIYCTRKSVPIRDTKYKVDGKFIMYYDELAITDRYGQGKRFENPYGVIMEGETSLNGKVIGEFICNEITRIARCGYDNERIELNIVDENLTIKKLDEGFLYRCQLSFSDIEKYANGNEVYGWHISNLKIYDKPKELSEFYKKDFKKALLYWEYLFSIDCVDDEPEPKEEDYILTKPPQSWCYVEGRKDR